MDHYIKVMKALSEPTRVKILKILQVKEMCVCEIKSLLGFAQPTVSRHLKILEESGLVKSNKQEMWVNYRLAAKRDHVYACTALKNLHDWLESDPEIEDLRKKIPSATRGKIKHQAATPGGKHLINKIKPASIRETT